jgi:hypothetical protein
MEEYGVGDLTPSKVERQWTRLWLPRLFYLWRRYPRSSSYNTNVHYEQKSRRRSVRVSLTNIAFQLLVNDAPHNDTIQMIAIMLVASLNVDECLGRNHPIGDCLWTIIYMATLMTGWMLVFMGCLGVSVRSDRWLYRRFKFVLHSVWPWGSIIIQAMILITPWLFS